jgi:hypothetical protein
MSYLLKCVSYISFTLTFTYLLISIIPDCPFKKKYFKKNPRKLVKKVC